MTRKIGYTPAPRKFRMTIFVNGQGSMTRRFTGDYTRDGWQIEKHNLKQMGFTPLETVNIPFRYWKYRTGLNPVYQYFVTYAIRFLGA